MNFITKNASAGLLLAVLVVVLSIAALVGSRMAQGEEREESVLGLERPALPAATEGKRGGAPLAPLHIKGYRAWKESRKNEASMPAVSELRPAYERNGPAMP